MHFKKDIKLVVFDLGNVVLKLDFDAPYRYWAECSGTRVDRLCENFMVDDAYKRFERGILPARNYCAHVCEKLGLTLTFEEFAIGLNSMFVGVQVNAPSDVSNALHDYGLI